MDVAGHTEITGAMCIIPCEVNATEAFVGPVNVDIFVMVAEALDEVVSMLFANVFYAKIVDDEAECDRAPLMTPKPRCVGNRCIAVFAQELDKLFFGEDSCLGETVHTAANFHVDFTFVYKFV